MTLEQLNSQIFKKKKKEREKLEIDFTPFMKIN